MGGGKGMEVGEEGDFIPNRYTVTTRMTPALRWAAMRAILIFHYLSGTKSQDSVHAQTTSFEEKGEPKPIRIVVRLLSSLTLYR